MPGAHLRRKNNSVLKDVWASRIFLIDLLHLMNKKKLFYWSLYDFANSIIFINFLLYFSQWMVIEGGLSDFWYNAIFAITSVALFFSAPALASFTDKHG